MFNIDSTAVDIEKAVAVNFNVVAFDYPGQDRLKILLLSRMPPSPVKDSDFLRLS
jgi:hypothetical protein